MSEQRSPSLITRSLSWVDEPRKVMLFFWLLVAGGAGLTLFDLAYKKKTYFEVEYLFGFYSFFAFIMCVALVLVGWIMRILLKRREDFYSPNDTSAEAHPAFDLDVEPPADGADRQGAAR